MIARGQQDMLLLDPIDVKPKLLVFALCAPPLFPSANGPSFSTINSGSAGTSSGPSPTLSSVSTTAYEYQLIASGGSGSYYWNARNTSVASVSTTTGLVRTAAARVGLTPVLVTDTRNVDIQARALVYVLEPTDLRLHACPVETHSGSRLLVRIRMNAEMREDSDAADAGGGARRIVPVNDCSRLQFEVSMRIRGALF